MAVFVRRPKDGLVLHSDRGCQYTSFAFGRRCEELRIAPSMGSLGDAYDNALIESFATLETEVLDRVRFRTCRQARREIFDFIEVFYNRDRPHSSIDYMTPERFEEEQLARWPQHNWKCLENRVNSRLRQCLFWWLL